MDNEKIENLLNLALNASPEERRRSPALQTGYLEEQKKWEVIVKFTGSLKEVLEKYPGVKGEELLNSYGILTVPEDEVDRIASEIQIAYMEKPKRLFFAQEPLETGGSPMAIGQNDGPYTGRGVLMAVIDSGIDYGHPDFRNPDGSTRIAQLWDQTLGKVYTKDQIDQALAAPDSFERYEIVPSRDLSGHGTHVAGIAAGNGRASDGKYKGMAPDSTLLVVKLGAPGENSFPRTTELMRAVNYALLQGEERKMPVVVNLSFGNNYGGHDGSALLETYLDSVSSYGRSVIVTGTGNEGASSIHTGGRLSAENVPVEIPFFAGAYETGFSIQIWKNFSDIFTIDLRHPSGRTVGRIRPETGTQRIPMEGTELLLYYGVPSPYSVSQEIFIDFIPTGSYVDAGIWEIILTPERIAEGAFDLWMPGQSVLSAGTGFLYPVESTTLTIPSTATKILSVAAYDARYNKLADFSGRGFTRNDRQIKPDVAAPGVEIISAAPGGGYAPRSGTSMAVPYVSGLAARMMEEGIIEGKDPYLYGEKIKAFLHRNAKELEVRQVYPNPELGWGAV